MIKNIENIVKKYFIEKKYLKTLEKNLLILENNDLDGKSEEKLIAAIEIFDILRDINKIIKEERKTKRYFTKENLKFWQIFYFNFLEFKRIKKVFTRKLRLYTKINFPGKFPDKFFTDCEKVYKRKIFTKPELEILQFFKDEKYKNYLIIPQYKIGVKYKSNLRADFFIYLDIFNKNKCIMIEYDGPQHYDENHFYFSKENIIKDEIKNNFCFEQNISLLRCNTTHFFKKYIDFFIKETLNNKKLYYNEYKNIKIHDNIPQNFIYTDTFIENISIQYEEKNNNKQINKFKNKKELIDFLLQ
jgi:hypothetical protein